MTRPHLTGLTHLFAPFAPIGGGGGGGEMEAIVELLAQTKRALITAIGSRMPIDDLARVLEEIAAKLVELEARIAALEDA